MKQRLSKICYFLHLTDGQGQLDILDLSFMGVIIKLLYAPNFDWSAVCVLIPILASQMHVEQLDYLKSKFLK